ncbi:MAG: hypothetical protein ABJK59_05960 [Erythrobacter sp.]|uniref:hypothetical protein n=1 Tax=Erythrobacter sp. TaxID=1042 RepID=UPI0032980679
MNIFTQSLALASIVFIAGCGAETQGGLEGEVSDIKTPYLGQTPPGLSPKLFAPEFISTGDLEIEGVFAPGMEEFYFTRQVNRDPINTHAVTYEGGEWSESLVGVSEGEVAISTDGNIMYLGNKYKERTASGWSETKSLGPDFEQFPIMRLTASAAGTYVFDERNELGILRLSRLIDGKRQAPEAFDEHINSGTFTAHPFIASDESYLIWDSKREGGFGDSDLYISFREVDGSWGPAINMGAEINTEFDDAFGSVTPDGKYFFFHRINLVESDSESFANIYWVDAKVIENLRPE